MKQPSVNRQSRRADVLFVGGRLLILAVVSGLTLGVLVGAAEVGAVNTIGRVDVIDLGILLAHWS